MPADLAAAPPELHVHWRRYVSGEPIRIRQGMETVLAAGPSR
jgi:hypothetical protein